MPWIDSKRPRKPRRTTVLWTEDGPVLFWKAPRGRKEMQKARQYVVYRFRRGERVDLEDASHILAITSQTFLPLAYEGGNTHYVYVVTALDRLQNESKAAKKNVQL